MYLWDAKSSKINVKETTFCLVNFQMFKTIEILDKRKKTGLFRITSSVFNVLI